MDEPVTFRLRSNSLPLPLRYSRHLFQAYQGEGAESSGEAERMELELDPDAEDLAYLRAQSITSGNKQKQWYVIWHPSGVKTKADNTEVLI